MQNQSNILISVIIITYAHEKYIQEAIEGVLLQKYNGTIELIIANDNSPDTTDEVIKKVIKKTPQQIKVKYTNHEINKGMMPNFIWALQQAKGKYIALCEGDDYWTDPLKLQKQVDFLELNLNYSIHSGNAYLLKKDELNMELLVKEERKSTYNFNDFVHTNHLITCTVMFRNKNIVFPEFYKNLKYGDWFMYLLLLENGSQAYYLNECLSVYRVHPGGVFNSQSEIEQIKNKIEYLSTICEYFNLKKNYKTISQEYNSLFFRLFKTYFIQKNYFMSIKTLGNHMLFLKKKFSIKHYAYHLKKYLKSKIYVN